MALMTRYACTTIFSTALIIVATVWFFGAGTIQAQSNSDFVHVTNAMLHEPDPADWLMWRRTLDSWGYSPLDQINRQNVSNLRMV